MSTDDEVTRPATDARTRTPASDSGWLSSSGVRTARQVSHPTICRVYDIAETDGQLFITMEYVDGEVPLTFDGDALSAGASWFTVAWLVALALAGFWMATASAAPARIGAPVRVE